ncbi:MAG TPA: MFS transporter, partial [Actinomycetota bacterium]|nr:MFS transporter [Actinomycetota bacterium]
EVCFAVRRYLHLLRNRPFAALWAGSTASAVGDAMTWVAIAWLGFERGGAGLVAALLVVSTAPVVVGGPVMGVALDRFERRRVLLTVNLVLGTAVGAVPVWAAVGGRAPTWLLFAVGGLYGLLKMANWAGVPSLIPDLVGSDELDTANAMESATFGIADVTGPAVAGALIGLIGAERVLAVDAATYLAFVVCLLALPRRRPANVPSATEGEPAGVGEAGEPVRLRPAFAFLLRNAPVRATTLMYMVINAGESMLVVLLPVYVRTVLGGGPRTYGLLVSVYAVGALSGTVVAGAVRWPWPLGRSIAVAAALSGSVLTLLALRPGAAGAAAVLGVAGLLASPLTVWAQTIRMRLIPERLRGRVFGTIRTLIQSTPPVGAAVAGALLAGAGVAAAALAMAAAVAGPGLAGLRSRSLRPEATAESQVTEAVAAH